jgi:hypothetical protein
MKSGSSVNATFHTNYLFNGFDCESGFGMYFMIFSFVPNILRNAFTDHSAYLGIAIVRTSLRSNTLFYSSKTIFKKMPLQSSNFGRYTCYPVISN